MRSDTPFYLSCRFSFVSSPLLSSPLLSSPLLSCPSPRSSPRDAGRGKGAKVRALLRGCLCPRRDRPKLGLSTVLPPCDRSAVSTDCDVDLSRNCWRTVLLNRQRRCLCRVVYSCPERCGAEVCELRGERACTRKATKQNAFAQRSVDYAFLSPAVPITRSRLPAVALLNLPARVGHRVFQMQCSFARLSLVSLLVSGLVDASFELFEIGTCDITYITHLSPSFLTHLQNPVETTLSLWERLPRCAGTCFVVNDGRGPVSRGHNTLIVTNFAALKTRKLTASPFPSLSLSPACRLMRCHAPVLLRALGRWLPSRRRRCRPTGCRPQTRFHFAHTQTTFSLASIRAPATPWARIPGRCSVLGGWTSCSTRG